MWPELDAALLRGAAQYSLFRTRAALHRHGTAAHGFLALQAAGLQLVPAARAAAEQHLRGFSDEVRSTVLASRG